MAGGQWTMPIPPSIGSALVAAATVGQVIPIPLAPSVLGPSGSGVSNVNNLLGVDGPSLLTVWDLESIYIPALVVATTLLPYTITAVVQLLLNGRLVWQQQEERTVTTAASQPITFSDNFQNPITVKRCDILAIAARAGADPGPVATQITLGVGLTNAGANPGATPGSIGYQAHEIPGRRRL